MEKTVKNILVRNFTLTGKINAHLACINEYCASLNTKCRYLRYEHGDNYHDSAILLPNSIKSK